MGRDDSCKHGGMFFITGACPFSVVLRLYEMVHVQMLARLGVPIKRHLLGSVVPVQRFRLYKRRWPPTTCQSRRTSCGAAQQVAQGGGDRTFL